MHIWMMLEDWFMQVQWIRSAPAVLEIAAATLAVALAAATWPRGCCKQDDLFQRRAV